MQIIGDGLLGRNLAGAFADLFPDVIAVAAGVSSTAAATSAEYDREAGLLYDILAHCRRDRLRLLFFSTASFSMYGYPAGEIAEDDPLRPPSVYGRHKLALETVVRSSGVEHLILRLSHVVGRHQRAHQLLPALVRKVQDGEVTVLEGAHRDLLDVRDLLHAVGRLLEERVAGEVVNVASGVPQPVERIVEAIEERLGVRARRIRRPGELSVTLASTRRLRRLVPDFRAGVSDADYLGTILDAYLPYYTGLSADVATLPVLRESLDTRR